MFVFLHGGMQGSWVWEPTLTALRAQDPDSRFLLLDVPGCGTKRGRETEGIAFDDIAAELASNIKTAGISDAVLVGHSQAGSLLPRIVELVPEQIRELVYISCIAPAHGQTVHVGTAGQEMKSGGQEQEPGPDRLRRMFCNDMTEAQADAFMAALGKDAWPRSSYAATEWRYEHLRTLPSTYVICLRDETVVPDSQRLFAERLHAKQVVSIDAGHQVMMTRPHALAEILLLETRQH